MLRIKVKCEGLSPILMNPATEELLDELFCGAGARKPRNIDRKPVDEAAKKVIKDENGHVGIPALYLLSCLVEAGRLIKFDSKRYISTKDSTLLYSFLSIEEFFFPFEEQTIPFNVDKRRGRLPDGVAVCVIRPRFDKWSFGFVVQVDEKEIAEEKIKQLFTKAGSSVGLGDFRPSCRGPFGRFKVVAWEKVENGC